MAFGALHGRGSFYRLLNDYAVFWGGVDAFFLYPQGEWRVCRRSCPPPAMRAPPWLRCGRHAMPLAASLHRIHLSINGIAQYGVTLCWTHKNFNKSKNVVFKVRMHQHLHQHLHQIQQHLQTIWIQYCSKVIQAPITSKQDQAYFFVQVSCFTFVSNVFALFFF